MTKHAENFMDFLLKKHKLTGQYSFDRLEYVNFPGYEDAIIELSNRGILKVFDDILGTIQVLPPQKD